MFICDPKRGIQAMKLLSHGTMAYKRSGQMKLVVKCGSGRFMEMYVNLGYKPQNFEAAKDIFSEYMNKGMLVSEAFNDDGVLLGRSERVYDGGYSYKFIKPEYK